MKTQPLKGMCDYLPREVALRDYLQNTILKVYTGAGYERISTPAVEDIENIDKSDGGDNLNLIFKILKRGEKLDEALASGEALCDMGLRYDLTLPLSRYYAANRQNLLTPAKCIQTDRVYRAERPQKGRLREFVQCDIDILGSKAPSCEVDLILTTAKALTAIGIGNFVIHINDRSLLTNVLLKIGVPQELINTVCVSLDKLDKIGVAGIREELAGKDLAPEVLETLMTFMSQETITLDSLVPYLDDTSAYENLQFIMNTVEKLSYGSVALQYDFTLIRGQGYYTGPVFEIRSRDFKGAIGGGGRYDHLIGKFIGEDVPAVGFSIGFERIFAILQEAGFEIPTKRKKIAALFYPDQMEACYAWAEEARKTYDVSMIEKSGKVGKLIAKLEAYGFDGIAEVTPDGINVKLFEHD